MLDRHELKLNSPEDFICRRPPSPQHLAPGTQHVDRGTDGRDRRGLPASLYIKLVTILNVPRIWSLSVVIL